jgi:hypothetical protein
MKKLIIITFLLLNTAYAYAGGSEFEIKVISFAKVGENEYHFKFIPLTTPYGQKLEEFNMGNETMTVIIKFGCSQSFYTCLFKKRTFTKKQHTDAINVLTKEAIPDRKISFGVMSSGFDIVNEKKGIYRSYGLFELRGVVYSYANSHL